MAGAAADEAFFFLLEAAAGLEAGKGLAEAAGLEVAVDLEAVKGLAEAAGLKAAGKGLEEAPDKAFAPSAAQKSHVEHLHHAQCVCPRSGLQKGAHAL